MFFCFKRGMFFRLLQDPASPAKPKETLMSMLNKGWLFGETWWGCVKFFSEGVMKILPESLQDMT